MTQDAQIIHKRFADLAKQIADETGIQVNSVYFDWFDFSSHEKRNLIVRSVRIDSEAQEKII